MKKNALIWLVAVVLVITALFSTQSFDEKSKNAGGSTSTASTTTSPTAAPTGAPTISPATGSVSGSATQDLPPDFTLSDLDGKSVKLSDLKGKKVYLNFWATWCGWCEKEMPDIEKIHKENPDLVILAIDVAEPKSLVSSFLKERGLTFGSLLDSDGKVTDSYGIQGFPTSIFINTDGTVSKRVEGMMVYEDMKASVEALK